MIRYEQKIEDRANEEIIDDICNYNTTKAVQLIVFELKMAAKLDAGLVKHNQNVNDIWNSMINQMISSNAKEILDDQ